MAEARYWEVEEARAYLPRLRRLLRVIRHATDISSRVHANGHGSLQPPEHDDPAADDDEAAADEGPVAWSDALGEFERNGIVLRDPKRGLIDFPACGVHGTVVHLCYELSEDDLGWWHLPDAGFASRRPLPLPPEL